MLFIPNPKETRQFYWVLNLGFSWGRFQNGNFVEGGCCTLKQGKKNRKKTQWFQLSQWVIHSLRKARLLKGVLHYSFKHLQPRKWLIAKTPAESKRTLKLSSQQGPIL